jgi:hypothetical protein
MSSKHADFSPLTETAFEHMPCMSPGFKSIDPAPMLTYPLENDRKNYCQMDKAIGKAHDGRYKAMG